MFDLKLKKIPAGGGFHSWHFENGSVTYSPRTFVVQLYLNDNFDGGETEFLYQNRREQAEEGDVLIFPAGAYVSSTVSIKNSWVGLSVGNFQ